MNSIIKNAETTFFGFAITIRYKEYRSVISALELFAEDESRITAIIKGIYMEIGLREHQGWRAVERNIWTVVQIAYNWNPLLMNEIVGCTLTAPPCASDFISALFVYNARQTKIEAR